MNSKETLAYWITEREAIWRRRLEQENPKPWSEDRVFQTVYFCNVHREKDKVTKWIRENYTKDFFGKNYDLAICASRLFNFPPTLLNISNDLVQFNPESILDTLHARQDHGDQVWGGAYLITTHGQKMPKSVYCVQVLCEADRLLPLDGITHCKDAFDIIQTIDGFGSFLSAQIAADLKNTVGHNLYNAYDKDEFAAPGPGSLRGLTWFMDHNVTKSTFGPNLLECRQWLESSSAAHLMLTVDNQDLQNCLCEYDKYMRVKSGTGRSKRKYDGV